MKTVFKILLALTGLVILLGLFILNNSTSQRWLLNSLGPDHDFDSARAVAPLDYTEADIDRLRQSVFNKGLAPATVGNCLGYLRRILRFNGIHLKVVMPNYNNEKTEDLTAEQQRALVTRPDQCKTIGNKPVCVFF